MFATLAAAATLAACSSYGMPLDPTAPHIEPWVGHDGALLRTSAPDGSLTPGIEGSVLFVRLLDSDGETVMDTYFQWPTDEKDIPAGSYSLVGYWSGCSGNCGNLGGEAPFCYEQIDVSPGDRVNVAVIGPTSLAPAGNCQVVIDGPG